MDSIHIQDKNISKCIKNLFKRYICNIGISASSSSLHCYLASKCSYDDRFGLDVLPLNRVVYAAIVLAVKIWYYQLKPGHEMLFHRYFLFHRFHRDWFHSMAGQLKMNDVYLFANYYPVMVILNQG